MIIIIYKEKSYERENTMEKNMEVFAGTDRLLLRKFQTEDIESFYTYRADPEISKYQSWQNYQYHEAKTFVHHQINHVPHQPGTWYQFAIALKETNELIGDCALHTPLSEPRIVEIGFTLSPEHQGKGYAKEAVCALINYLFHSIKKHKVIAFTDVRNNNSIAVLERVGMRREGHFLQNYMSKGQWVDEYQYSILATEWESSKFDCKLQTKGEQRDNEHS